MSTLTYQTAQQLPIASCNRESRPIVDRLWGVLIAAAVSALSACGGSDDLTGNVPSGPPATTTVQIFVSASASAPGTGTRAAPYATLSAAQQASKPGDTIIVLASPLSVPPLDGGIALQAGQKLVGDGPSVVADNGTLGALPRISNTSTSNSGDAVTLADNAVVSNLVIVNTKRGGVYGKNVSGAIVTGNDISSSNTSCTPGLVIYFVFSGNTILNGWAAVMVDADSQTSSLSVTGNRIHDSLCSDGIDVRATGTAVMTANIDSNQITRLTQGPGLRSILAIGTQTRDTAQLTVTSDGNAMSYLGSAGADCEGLFSNQTGGSLKWIVTNNAFAHGIGGSSCNGAEFFAGGGTPTSDVSISHSSFVDNAGDMIEQNNLSAGVMTLKLDHVTVSHTASVTVPPVLPPVPGAGVGATGQGYCLSVYTSGPGASSHVSVLDSELSDCQGDGINAFFANLASSGTGAGNEISIDIERSTISSVRQYALRWLN